MDNCVKYFEARRPVFKIVCKQKKKKKLGKNIMLIRLILFVCENQKLIRHHDAIGPYYERFQPILTLQRLKKNMITFL